MECKHSIKLRKFKSVEKLENLNLHVKASRQVMIRNMITELLNFTEVCQIQLKHGPFNVIKKILLGHVTLKKFLKIIF